MWSINKLKVLNQEIFHTSSTITTLSGKLINTDDYNFSYYNGTTAVAREPRKQGFERGRSLPRPYYNYIDIEADDKSSRIRISCSISGYGYCRDEIQKDINIDTLDGLHGIAYIKPIHYRGGIRNLIFYLEIKYLSIGLKKDRYFFEDLYKTELSYYYRIYLIFILIYLINMLLNFVIFTKIKRISS